MKCHDIAELLNEREPSGFSAAELAELEAHVSRCAECAAQHRVSERLAAFRVAAPPLPATLRERARHLQAECESAASPRSTRRPMIIGSLFLLGAAATMFATGPWQDTSTANQ